MERGSPAATTLPNTRMRRIRTTGNVIVSAFRRSFSTWVPTCLNTSAWPPTAIVRGPVERVNFGESSLTRSRTSSASPAILARRMACRESVLRSGGGEPRLQYENACWTPGSAATFRVRAVPAVETAGSSTVPTRAVTRSTRFGFPAWKARSKTPSARSDSDPGSVNPPFESRWITLPPKAAATTTPMTVPMRIPLRRRTVKRPSRSSIPFSFLLCLGYRR